MKYKDNKGNTLYGFSQENLERTNKEIRQTNKYMKIMVILFAIFLVIIVSLVLWLELNNIMTKIIYM